MTVFTKEEANELFETIASGWTDKEKLEFVQGFKTSNTARINLLKAEQNLIKFEIEDLEKQLALIEKSPLDYFNGNGPWGVTKAPELQAAENTYNELLKNYNLMIAGEDE